MFNKFFKYLLLFLLISLVFYLVAEENPTKNTIAKTTETAPSFGYWEHLNLTKLSDREKITSENDLYRYVLDHLELDRDDKTLEVGSFKGLGAKIIYNEYKTKTYTSIDFSNNSIQQAKNLNQDLLDKHTDYRYLAIKAQKIPFNNQSFTKIFSVDAVLDFYSFKNFVYEAERLLKQNGKIVIAAPFAKNYKSQALLRNYNQINDNKLPLIEEVRSYFKSKGFVDLHIEPIGQYVFDGFDKWLTKTGQKNSPDHNWKAAYDENMIDYYVISAYKPVELIRM